MTIYRHPVNSQNLDSVDHYQEKKLSGLSYVLNFLLNFARPMRPEPTRSKAPGIGTAETTPE
jgi:hypothetical protein